MIAGPLQSPTLHSAGNLQSPGGMSSPGGHCLTPLSPTSSTSMASPPGLGQPHTTLGTKHICAICQDKASGKHYGVYRYILRFFDNFCLLRATFLGEASSEGNEESDVSFDKCNEEESPAPFYFLISLSCDITQQDCFEKIPCQISVSINVEFAILQCALN